jgi:hypothetical protein
MEIVCGPYLQNVSPHAITVMWHTDLPATAAVEYGPRPRLGAYAYDEPQAPTYSLRAESSRLATVHAITLDGLLPEHEYDYRVVATAPGLPPVSSAGASFFTAVRAGSPFSFATYGDSLRVAEVHQRNAALARAYRASLCVGAGDHAQDVSARFPPDFFASTRDLLRYTPWFAAMGNHDSPNDGYFQFFHYPEPRYWYAFDYGCAHFVVLNSNMDYRPGSEQWTWLEADLRSAQDARWRFVFIHHPPFCSNNYEIPQTRVLCALFERYHVHIVYSAHATLYNRFHPMTQGRYDRAAGVVYVVSGGGGYDMSLPPSQLWDHTHPTTALARAANHFLLTTVTPDECRVRAIDTGDHVFDGFTLQQPQAGPPRASPAAPVWPFPAPSTGRLAGFDDGPVGWVFPRPQFAVDEAEAHAGGRSLRWYNVSGRPCLPAIRRVLKDEGRAYEAVAGKAYELSAWVKTEGVTGGVTLSLEWNGDMGFMGRVTSAPLAGTHDWTRVAVTVPPLPRYIYACRILLSAVPAAAGTAWFDEVQLAEIQPGG